MIYTPFLITGLAVGAIYALSGIGLVVLFRATGVLNFAYGGIGAVGALLAWQLIDADVPVALAWLAAIVVSTLLSFLYGRFIAPSLAYRSTIIKGVATLGYTLILLGFSNWIWGDIPRRLRFPTDTLGFSVFDVRITVTRVIALILAIVITIAISLLINRTRLGLHMRALANNRDLSSVLGLNVLRVETLAWLLSGFMAGVSGLMLANLVRLNAGILTFLVIPAIAAAIVGRMRSLWLTLFGGIAIGMIESGITPIRAISSYRSMTPFVIAILVILWLQTRESNASFKNE